MIGYLAVFAVGVLLGLALPLEGEIDDEEERMVTRDLGQRVREIQYRARRQ